MFCCACFLPSCISADEDPPPCPPPPSVPQLCFRVLGSRLRPRLQGPQRRGVLCGKMRPWVSPVVKDGGEIGSPPRVWTDGGRCLLPNTRGIHCRWSLKKKKKCKRRLTPLAEDVCVGVLRACPAMTDLHRFAHVSCVPSINTSNLRHFMVQFLLETFNANVQTCFDLVKGCRPRVAAVVCLVGSLLEAATLKCSCVCRCCWVSISMLLSQHAWFPGRRRTPPPHQPLCHLGGS